MLSTSFVFSQNKPKNDSTEICFPYQVGQKILLELNECDKNKELLKVSEKEIGLLNDKIKEKDGIIGDLKKLLKTITKDILGNKLQKVYGIIEQLIGVATTLAKFVGDFRKCKNLIDSIKNKK